MAHTVHHDPARQRFETTVDGHLCVADYRLQGDVVWMTHTGVPAQVGGQGVASELVKAALEWVRERGFKVEPACSYVDAWMRRHPESADLRAR